MSSPLRSQLDLSTAGLKKKLPYALLLAVVAFYFETFLRPLFQTYKPFDLYIYRAAGAALLAGEPFYEGFKSPFENLPFIYPPFAALLFTALTPMPQLVAGYVWLLLCILLPTGIIVYGGFILAQRHGAFSTWSKKRLRLLVLVLTPVLILTAQASQVVFFGQIDAVIAALVVVDLVFLPRKYQGLLIGLGAGLKITPLAFLVFSVFRRRLLPVVRALASLAATVVVGWLVAPGPSKDFWTSQVFDTTRAGALDYDFNQTLSGLLHRWLPSDAGAELAWKICVVILGLLLCYQLKVLVWDDKDQFMGLVIFCLYELLCQPMAVVHHWLIIILLLPYLAYLAQTNRTLYKWVLPGAVICLFYDISICFWINPDAEGQPHLWLEPQSLSGCYLVIVLLVATIRLQRRQIGQTSSTC